MPHPPDGLPTAAQGRRRSLAARVRGRLRWEAYRASLAWNDRIRAPWHDWRVARHLAPAAGDLPGGPRVAVYAIYPERGLLPSHLRALDHLAALGFAPFLVSNLPLTPEERARVAPRVWRRLERPNYGYDIAGYRAAILLLAPDLARLDRLVLVNDSTWFPVGRGRHWLAVAEAMPDPPPLVGCITNGGFVHAPLGTPQSWAHDPRLPEFHYCTFGLSLGPAILRDPDFTRFWRRLRITDVKIEIVKRAELGFTQWALARGHAHACTWDIAGLPDRLARRTPEALRALIAGLVIPEDDALRAWRARMLGPEGPGEDRAGLVNVLLTAIAHTGAGFALPALMMDEDGFGMVKKAPLRRETLSRAATLAALAADPAILAEAEAIPGPALPARS